MRFTLAAALLLLAAPAVAQDHATAAERIFFDPALRDADYDRHAETLIDVIEDDPSGVEALVALRRVLDLEDELASYRPVHEMLVRLSADDFAACGLNADEFAGAFIDYARAFSSEDAAGAWMQTAKRWRGITEAAFIGPFGEGDGSIHDDAFSPEAMIDFGATCQGPWGELAWRELKHHDPVAAKLDLHEQTRFAGYGYYVATSLLSDAERDAHLNLSFSGPGKVWWNGRCIADYDARRRKFPELKTLGVTLDRGTNLVMVKLSARSTIEIRARDTNGRPLDGVIAAVPDADLPPTPVRGATAETDNRPAELARLDEQDDVTTQLMRCAILEHAGLRNRSSIEVIGEAEDWMNDPRYPYVVLRNLLALEDSPLHSGSEQRRLSRIYLDALMMPEHDFLPAKLKQAELYSDDDRHADAIKLLEDALESTDHKWRVYLAMDEVFRDARWRMERERVLKLARGNAPDALPVLRALRRYYSEHAALANEIEIDRRVLELVPGDRDAHVSLMHALGRTGQAEESLRHARVLVAQDPANTFLLGNLAEALTATGDLDGAVEAYGKIAAMSARPGRAWFDAARACLQLGDDDRGTEILNRVLELDPGHHLARRQLQLMRGEEEDFWSAHAVSWDDAMQHDVSRTDFPRADSALVLDEMIQRVYPDGSSVSYVHTVRKILTQEGVDVRGRERIRGELINARTVKADGTVLEPISARGGMVEFPGVEVGCYLDVEYIARFDGGPTRALDGDAFFFMDQNFTEPFAISRWVLETPEGMDLNVVSHNLDADDEGVKITRETRDGITRRVWDVRNPRNPDYENFMPSTLEVIPWIEFVQPRDWREVARRLADEGLGNIMATDLIERQARAILLDHEDAGDIARARVIYEWVNENITTEGNAWNAHQALVAGSGEREELFISLCAAADIHIGFAYVDAPAPYKQAPEEGLPRPHWAYPRDDDFDALMIVIRDPGGELAWVDMEHRLRPFGEISARRFNAPAILWLDGNVELTHMPGGDREGDSFENRVRIELQDDGAASMNGEIIVHGERSYPMKEELRNASYDRLCRDLEGDLARHYPGFEAGECRFPEIGAPGTPLVRGYTGTVRRLARERDGGLALELPGEKLGRLLSILVSEQRREFDLDVNFDLVQTDEIRITPPEGFAFADLPRDLIFPTAPLMYSLKFRMDGKDLVIDRKLVFGPGRITPADYPNLVEQVKKIRQKEDSTLNLTKIE